MPLAPIRLLPGVRADYTPTLNEAAIQATQLIRWKEKLPQKYGGWEEFFSGAVGSVPRRVHAWEDLSGESRLAVGAEAALDSIKDGALTDITPQTLVSDFPEDFSTTNGDSLVDIVDGNISNVTTLDGVFFNTPIAVGGLILHGLYPIEKINGTHAYSIRANANATSTVANGGIVPRMETVSGSSIVTITLANHGLAVGNVFTFPLGKTLNGVTIQGTYPVLTVPTANTFTIGASTVANATTGAPSPWNSGNAQLVYYINLGPPASGTGYGVGPYGVGGYGSGVVGGAQTGDPITATNWSLDNWGEFLVACPENGGLYYWPPDRGFTNAQMITTGPPFNAGMFIAMPARIMVAWGSCSGVPGSTSWSASPDQQDPLQIRWSDIENFFVWSVNDTTQAGGFRLSSGSKIIGAVQAPQYSFFFTDIGVWSSEYVGPPIVFALNEYGKGCGLIARNAVTVMRGIVYWMSLTGFYMIGGGGVQPIECTVWDIVFQDLDRDNAHKCFAWPNSSFTEIMWFYPSITDGTGEPTRYVKLTVDEGMLWDYGTLNGTCGIDQSVLGQAIRATQNGNIYQHERGNDAAGQPMVSWYETGYFALENGDEFVRIDRYIPDMKWGTVSGDKDAEVQITITCVDYPNGREWAYGPVTVTSAKNYATTRVRGRQAKILTGSSDLGSWWRQGQPSYQYSLAGRR